MRQKIEGRGWCEFLRGYLRPENGSGDNRPDRAAIARENHGHTLQQGLNRQEALGGRKFGLLRRKNRFSRCQQSPDVAHRLGTQWVRGRSVGLPA